MIRRFAPIESLETLMRSAREARSEARMLEATELYRQATREGVRLGRPFVVVDSLNALGAMAYESGDRNRAARRFGLALKLARASGHARGEAAALVNLGTIAFADGDHGAAIAHCRRGRWAYRRARSTAGESRALDTLGRILTEAGRGDAAARCRQLARELARTVRTVPPAGYVSGDTVESPILF